MQRAQAQVAKAAEDAAAAEAADEAAAKAAKTAAAAKAKAAEDAAAAVKAKAKQSLKGPALAKAELSEAVEQMNETFEDAEVNKPIEHTEESWPAVVASLQVPADASFFDTAKPS